MNAAPINGANEDIPFKCLRTLPKEDGATDTDYRVNTDDGVTNSIFIFFKEDAFRSAYAGTWKSAASALSAAAVALLALSSFCALLNINLTQINIYFVNMLATKLYLSCFLFSINTPSPSYLTSFTPRSLRILQTVPLATIYYIS